MGHYSNTASSRVQARPLEASSPGNRFHYLDAARATMLVLGIPFHASETYRISGGFNIESPDTSMAASLISAVVHCFRMPAFFMLSGFFAALLLSRRLPQVWLKGRITRVGVPLVFTTLLLGPVETAFELVAQEQRSFLQALIAALEAPAHEWIGHRWFLIVLLIYCLCAALLKSRMVSPKLLSLITKPRRFVPLAAGLAISVSPFVAIAVSKLTGEMLAQSVAVKAYTLQSIKYAPYFVIGYFVCRSGNMRFMSGRLTNLESSLAAVTIIAYIATYFALYPAEIHKEYFTHSKEMKALLIANEAWAGYFGSRLFFAAMQSIFSERNSVVEYFVDASFVVYIFHKLFLNIMSGLFLTLGWAPVSEIILSSAVAMTASMLCYELIRRSIILSFLINGGAIKPLRRSTPSYLPSST